MCFSCRAMQMLMIKLKGCVHDFLDVFPSKNFLLSHPRSDVGLASFPRHVHVCALASCTSTENCLAIHCRTLQCQAGDNQKEESAITRLGSFPVQQRSRRDFQVGTSVGREIGMQVQPSLRWKNHPMVMAIPSVHGTSADSHERPPLKCPFLLQFL